MRHVCLSVSHFSCVARRVRGRCHAILHVARFPDSKVVGCWMSNDFLLLKQVESIPYQIPNHRQRIEIMVTRVALVVLVLLQNADAFQPRLTTARYFGLLSLQLHAKKKKGQQSGSKGFGKVEEQVEAQKPANPKSVTESSPAEPPLPKGAFFQSVDGGTDRKPELEDLPPEERTKQILREKYGMQALDEQQANETEQLKAQQKRLAKLKKKAELEEDVDFMAMILAPVLKGLDTFLKAGVAIPGTLFILAGIGITLEAPVGRKRLACSLAVTSPMVSMAVTENANNMGIMVGP